jgi:purine-nucleoside phosphorylase
MQPDYCHFLHFGRPALLPNIDSFFNIESLLMSTIHINAPAGAFADTVLFPGDPLRAKFIADNFLHDVIQVNDIRNMLGFTGNYKGKRLSVMGSGMGIPSCMLYAKELITEYGVKNIIRIGTAGGLKGTQLKDLVIALSASTDSSVNRSRLLGYDFAPCANFELARRAVEAARTKNLRALTGNCFSSDYFYHPVSTLVDQMEKMGVLCIEMEAAGLYGVASEYGANALAILTISDHIRTGEEMTAEERQIGLRNMVEVALETVPVVAGQ